MKFLVILYFIENDKFVTDSGVLLNATLSPEEVEARITQFSSGEKYEYLTSHFVPPANYTFPSVYMNGCNREFKSSWLKKYNWLVYSPSLDGVLCLHCALFCDNRKQKGALMNRPFNKWTKISSELVDHANNAYHSRAMSASKLFVDCINKPELTLPDRFDTTRRQRRVENRHILKMIIKAILFCGKQCIAL